MNTTQYQYDFSKLSAISKSLQYPMADTIPPEDNSFTKKEWALAVASVLLRIQANQALYDLEIKRGSLCKLVWYIRLYKLLSNPAQKGFIERIYKVILAFMQTFVRLTGQTPKSEDMEYDIAHRNVGRVGKRINSMLDDVQKQASRRTRLQPLLFKNYQDLFQLIYLPCVTHHVLEDREFAAQRVAGANPLVLQRVDSMPVHFPVTNRHYQAAMGGQDSLTQALQEGRLYLTDYKVLEEIEAGTFPEGQKFLCQPIALFAMESSHCPHRRLKPVAIQCNQDPSQNPIFTPPTLHSSVAHRWGWQIAKLMVQIADGNYHELISHLGRTHLLIEPIVVATHRQLPAEHPLNILFLPHFEGTLFINDFAVKSLINPGGTVDRVLAGTLKSSVLLSVKGAKGFPFAFNESFLPTTLKKRGVDDPQRLPDYPYRDDALLIWNAIHNWVSRYLKIFYADDNAVQQDTKLQNWLAELIAQDGGQMSEIGQTTDDDSTPRIRTLDYLIDATTLIIFTSSAQHAAVNFPQSSLMTYMPNMALAAYREAPRSIDGLEESNFFEILPSLAQSETQMNMTYLLGSVYYTTLGQYQQGYFKDSRVSQPLNDFVEELQHIERIIEQRNESRATYYDVLKPSKIPQSINI